MQSSDDDTLRLKPAASPPSPPRQDRHATALRAGIVLALLGAMAVGSWTWIGPLAPPPATPSGRPPSLSQARIPLAGEADLLALRPELPVLRRLRENPRVFVLLFPNLDMQGAALNRAAALIEKAGLPRDRVLERDELDFVIARSGDTAATWYLGHDYRGSDLARFFALAAQDGITLNEAELWVRDQLAAAEAEAGPGPLAVISTASPGPQMDSAMCAAVLRHEIGHGYYFTLPGFAEHVRAVWHGRFTAVERAAFRTFLAREGYDPNNDDLMANETMAYLLFTPDPRLFAPTMVGMTEAGVERLRGLLRDGLPLP